MIDHNGYDLRGKFDYYNGVCFGGALPRLPLRFASLKGRAGKCQCKWLPPADSDNLSRRLRQIGAKHVPGSVRIVLDKTFLRSEQDIDATLIHEMIHAWFFLKDDIAENHGLNFIAKTRQCEAKVGFRIPLTEKLNDPVLASHAVKKLIVILWERARRENLYAVINPTSFDKMRAGMRDEWAVRGDIGDRLLAYEIETTMWARQAQNLPEQRPLALFGKSVRAEMKNGRYIRGGIKGAVKFYYQRRADLLTDLRQNGKVLLTLEREGARRATL